jgi:hypothetical protein
MAATRSSKPFAVVRRRPLKFAFVRRRLPARRMTANDSQIRGQDAVEPVRELAAATDPSQTADGFLNRVRTGGRSGAQLLPITLCYRQPRVTQLLHVL